MNETREHNPVPTTETGPGFRERESLHNEFNELIEHVDRLRQGWRGTRVERADRDRVRLEDVKAADDAFVRQEVEALIAKYEACESTHELDDRAKRELEHMRLFLGDSEKPGGKSELLETQS